MLETVTFPVGFCACCDKRVVLARELDDHDNLVSVCPHCDTVIAESEFTMGGHALRTLGYDVEGEGPKTAGCGTGGSCNGCSR